MKSFHKCLAFRILLYTFAAVEGYKPIIISTIVDIKDCESEEEGYKPIIISTIVDSGLSALQSQGYKPIIISTIVDLDDSILINLKAISQ